MIIHVCLLSYHLFCNFHRIPLCASLAGGRIQLNYVGPFPIFRCGLDTGTAATTLRQTRARNYGWARFIRMRGPPTQIVGRDGGATARHETLGGRTYPKRGNARVTMKLWMGWLPLKIVGERNAPCAEHIPAQQMAFETRDKGLFKSRRLGLSFQSKTNGESNRMFEKIESERRVQFLRPELTGHSMRIGHKQMKYDHPCHRETSSSPAWGEHVAGHGPNRSRLFHAEANIGEFPPSTETVSTQL